MQGLDKEEIQGKILNVISDFLKKGELTAEETTKIALFVKGKIQQVNSKEELTVFLKELSEKWPIFNNLLLIEKGEEKQKEDLQAAEEAEELIKEGKLDEAITVAKSAIGE